MKQINTKIESEKFVCWGKVYGKSKEKREGIKI